MKGQCHHTVHLTNEQGQRIGSWRTFNDRFGEYVACDNCGKWYGRIPKGNERNATAPAKESK